MSEINQWITVHPNGKESKGQPIPVKEGQTKGEAVKSFISKHKDNVKELEKKSIEELKKDAIIDLDEKKTSSKAFTLKDLPQKRIDEADAYIKEKGWGREMKKSMYGRMLSDLNNFFGVGGRSDSVLWAKDLGDHLAFMKVLDPVQYNNDIKQYEILVGKRDFEKIYK